MANKYVKVASSRARRGVERLAGAINLNGKQSAEVVNIAGVRR